MTDNVTPTELSQWDDDYQNADGKGGDYDSVPDGKYVVAVEKAQLARTKSDKPMLKMQLRISGPTQAGRVLFKNSMIATAQNVEFLKRDLVACGVDLVKLSDLPGRLEELLDITLEVRKVTKGEYENVYIQKRLDDATGDACPPPPGDDFFHGVPEPDDGMPF